MSSSLSAQLKLDPNSPKGNLADYSHASKLFVDGDMRLAPKVKFLYHVVFDINTAALVSLGFKYKHQNEINMLVKKVDLPKFTIQAETINQYNRKKVIQNKIDYNPVSISFHDDSYGVTRQLWENYYSYYYADSISTKMYGAYDPRNSTKSGAFTLAAYGLDNASTKPFFNKITIYQMSKGQWNSYALINPIISGWNHDTLDYSQNAPVENNMTLMYEAVQYKTGTVSQNSPPGFGSDHYDTQHSPLTLGSVGGSQTTSSQMAGLATTGQMDQTPTRSPSLTQALGSGNKLTSTISAITTVAAVTPALGGLKNTFFPGIK